MKKNCYNEKSTLPTTRESDIEAAEAEAAATTSAAASNAVTAATPGAAAVDAAAAAGPTTAASKRFCNQRSSSPAFFPFSDGNGQCTIFFFWQNFKID